jgi:phosphoenolpyruvate---glycerone phosphotransferase subunit DhaL
MPESVQSDVELILHTMATTAVANEKEWSDLDAVVGDGDFGYSLARGFEKVLEGWDDFDRSDPGTFVKKVAIVITSRVGGTSGPIWGTAMLRVGASIGDRTELSAADVITALEAAVEGIKQRGGADLGEKTLLDSLVPGIEQLRTSLATADGSSRTSVAEAIGEAAVAAREAAEATRGLIAQRGRAAYSGERSIGTLDAGAVGVAVMFEQVAEAWDA